MGTAWYMYAIKAHSRVEV